MVVAAVETITYLVLVTCWLGLRSDAGTAVAGFLHGLVWMAFVGMAVLIREDVGWTWGYVALVVATGPIGGVLVWARLRRTRRDDLEARRPPGAGR